MKKIGIITFHSAYNYGAMLQVFALQEFLLKKYDVRIINYRNQDIDNQYKLFRIVKGNIYQKAKCIISSALFFSQNYRRNKNFLEFMNTSLNLTNEYSSKIDLAQKLPLFDIYIAGSDQIWNTDITNGLNDVYTLGFAPKDKKRISYAASIGDSKIVRRERELFIEKLSNLDKISVREETAKKELEIIGLNKKISVVVDPTLLITANEWGKIISSCKREYEHYIFAYYVAEDDSYYDILNELSTVTGIPVIHANKRRGKIKSVKANCYTNGPLDFINLIKNAEYVVTTSFHATVFSIIFNKKFWVVPHKKTGSRVVDLLNKLGLSSRAVNSFEGFKKKKYDEDINWKKVNEELAIEREKSINWLLNAIEK